MSTLGELAIKLGLDTVQFQNGLKKAEYAARQTSERTQTYLKNIEKAANSLNDTHMTISQAFTNIWSYRLEKYFLILSLNLVGEMSRL
ncbi:hypothetical protein [Gallibacterium anatis]|uniref:Uncharacterized protein n=1 Tax=Gallibacterium anatis 12656/12 TaxID=1195244 RepID=U1I7Q6_9PAST|nr:hypothetical protein [Gallibacterium anatis]ERF78279.1 hypothetical protein N561_06890 [Gallibacterium anatis 12656/12]KGQ48675.1 hypothetical protein JL04_07460 [Gallibacterium anatis]KGQ49039.1 hypothetical protein JL12_07810 [Gallibacterium anatis 10672-6]